MRTEGVPKVVVTTLSVAADTPHQHFRELRTPERSAPHVIAMPSRSAPRVSSDISCRISAAVARICTRGLIVIAGAYATTTWDFFPRFEEDAGRTRVNHRFEHASWAQTDGTSPLEHGHVSVACLKTYCRLPIRICPVLREMATWSKSARITGTSCQQSPQVVQRVGTRSLLNSGQNFVVVRRLCRL
jgi:hypothetical protein